MSATCACAAHVDLRGLHQLAAVPVVSQRVQRRMSSPGRNAGRSNPTECRNWQPLALEPVGAPPGYVLHVPRIYQTRPDTSLLKNVIQRNPINARRFHGHRGHAALHKPIRQPLEILGEGREKRARDFRRDLAEPATNISRAPTSTPPAFGSKTGRSPRHIPFCWRRPSLTTHAAWHSPFCGFAGCCFLLICFPSEPQAAAKLCIRRYSSKRNQLAFTPTVNHCFAHGAWNHASDRRSTTPLPERLTSVACRFLQR